MGHHLNSSTKLPVRFESGAPEARPNSNLRWYKPSILSHPIFAKCKAFPREVDNKIDYLVLGRPKTDYNYCSIAREYENMCGQDGKYYEKRCTLMDNIKNKN